MMWTNPHFHSKDQLFVSEERGGGFVKSGSGLFGDEGKSSMLELLW